jgi:hypothetical protein
MRTSVRDVAGVAARPVSARAVERGNVLQAVAIARDLGELSLSSSFALLLMFAEHDLSDPDDESGDRSAEREA